MIGFPRPSCSCPLIASSDPMPRGVPRPSQPRPVLRVFGRLSPRQVDGSPYLPCCQPGFRWLSHGWWLRVIVDVGWIAARSGRSLLAAMRKQKAELRALSRSDVRGESNLEQTILLTLEGWTSLETAKAFSIMHRRCGTGYDGSASAAHTYVRTYEKLSRTVAASACALVRRKLPSNRSPALSQP